MEIFLFIFISEARKTKCAPEAAADRQKQSVINKQKKGETTKPIFDGELVKAEMII